MPSVQFIPESEISLHVPNLGHALPVVGIVTAPVAERFEIKILAVEIDALGNEHSVDVIDQPFPRIRIAQIEEAFGFRCGIGEQTIQDGLFQSQESS